LVLKIDLFVLLVGTYGLVLKERLKAQVVLDMPFFIVKRHYGLLHFTQNYIAQSVGGQTG